MLEKFSLVDQDLYLAYILRLGYTQGELNPEVFEDFDHDFNAVKHTYWNFLLLIDETGELDCDFLLINLNNQEEKCFDTDEDLAEKIGLICSDLSEDMFGYTISPIAFESVVMGVLDEPDGYEYMDDILETIGGELLETIGNGIPESCVNSLFCMLIEIPEGERSISNNQFLIKNKNIDLEENYNYHTKIVYFTEDVMTY